MKVDVFESVNQFDTFDFEVTSIREILNALELHCGIDYVSRLTSGQYRFILFAEDESKAPVYLQPEVVFTEFTGYDRLVMIPDAAGAFGAEVAIALGLTTTAVTATGATVTTLTTLGLIVAAVVNIAIAVALGAIMSALSPTSEFSSDPAEAQSRQSSLFNGAPIIREQGGSVPLVYGNPYCGGVLIASSLSTAEG